MLTPEQEAWIMKLSDTRPIEIFPYDPTSEARFAVVESKIKQHFGNEIEVMHSGASSLKISGQREIDVYVPVLETDFDNTIARMTEVFGPLQKLYPMDRARFRHMIDSIEIQLFIINKETENWRAHLVFQSILSTSPQILSRYVKLKEEGSGLTVREYYRRKTEFINDVLMLGQNKPSMR